MILRKAVTKNYWENIFFFFLFFLKKDNKCIQFFRSNHNSVIKHVFFMQTVSSSIYGIQLNKLGICPLCEFVLGVPSVFPPPLAHTVHGYCFAYRLPSTSNTKAPPLWVKVDHCVGKDGMSCEFTVEVLRRSD